MRVSVCSHRPVLEPCGLEDLDHQVDPYIGCEHHCHYCYALNGAETDWAREILIHAYIVGQLREELGGLPPQRIYMGYHSDPYQPCEAEQLQTRKVLELFRERGFAPSILTKSDLVVRDADILKDMDGASVSVSVAFNDNAVRRSFEAKTTDTEARIEALRQLRRAGIRTSALICPVIPHITDPRPLIDPLAPHCDAIWIYGLSMEDRSSRNWRNVETILEDLFPDLKEHIEQVVFSKDHSYWTQLREGLKDIQEERQLDLRIHL
jgi:DNA repair photolyase